MSICVTSIPVASSPLLAPTCAAIPTNPGRAPRAISFASDCWRRITARRSRDSGNGLSLQPIGVPAQMIGHEGRDEIVAVVVTGLPTQGEGDVRFVAGG